MTSRASLTRRSFAGLAAAGLAAGLLPTPAAAAASRSGARVRLPAPTGPCAIGVVSARLVDRSRPDPWVPALPYRELMVDVWYPAAPGRPGGGHRLAPYMAPGAAARWDAGSPHGIPRGALDFAALRTHARQAAPPETRGGRRPVLVYAAGAGDPRTWGTTLVEELASRGHVVVTVDHTYESPGVQFPDGSVKDNGPLLAALAEAEREGTMSALLKKVLGVRVADARFVLDRLGSLPHGLSAIVDRGRVGMVGQSAGGVCAAQTMYEDRRVTAGVDLDGTLEFNPEPNGTNLLPVARHGLDRPFLLMGREGSDRTTEPSWRSFWAHSTGWKRNVTLRDSRHQTYTDLATLLPAAGVDRATIEEHIGTVDPARTVAVQRAYVASFFDRWLKGEDDGLLERPSGRYPEAEFAG
ncbi:MULTISPECIES: alpha/beta hydrolase family protein [Streptomyces]|uniref:alpha/beta hydrolase family protein n=1 Tax=Streptomyces TaxID=1883 RepID=UPI001E63C836|nr:MULTISPECIES: hydrolase [Streptomyces]UFQ17832.1 hydrolase [Streptomyces huasconensis]WCL87438.1 hydrolase [Streptomyces sp. JCM 35825]